MRLPSLQYMYDEAAQAFKRFPLTLLSATLGAAILLFMIETDKEPDDYLHLTNLILTCILGIPLTFSVQLFVERLENTDLQRLMAYGFAVLLLVIHYFSLPENSNHFIPYIRFFLFNIALHFLVAFIPYTHKGSINGFWHYNKTLFIRFLTAIIFSATLCLGIFFAYLCLDLLFDININQNWYVHTFILCGAIFNTWFFVAGVPDKLAALDQEETYPMGLKIFAQYILMPLMMLYLVILYSYVGKIVVEWNWPKGIISYLILGVSVVGILALLLLHPLTTRENHSWLAKVAKGYYILLVPLSFVLSLAVWRRVSEYGITENRYFLILLALWLIGTSLYFVFSRQKNIKILPISLFVLIIISAVGPLSAFTISKNSQINRLEKLLIEEGFLLHGQFQIKSVVSEKNLPVDVFDIIHYLNDRYYLADLNPWFTVDLDTILVEKNTIYENEKTFLALSKLDLYRPTLSRKRPMQFHFRQDITALSLQEVDYWFKIDVDCYHLDCIDKMIRKGSINGKSYQIKAVDNHSISLQMNQQVTAPPIFIIQHLDSIRQQETQSRVRDRYTMVEKKSGEPPFILESVNDNYELQLMIQSANLKEEKGNWVLSYLNGMLLVKEK